MRIQLQGALKIMRRMKNLEKKKAWERWKEVVEFERRMRIQLQGALKIMRRMKNLEKKKAWERWKEVVEFERRMRIQLQGALKIMRRMKNLEKKKAWERWVEFHEEIAARENAIREQKVAIVLKRIMHGTTSRVFRWHLIIQRNKRFFRKQQALKRATAAGDTVIRQKRKTLVAIAWRAWKYQMVCWRQAGLSKTDAQQTPQRGKGTYLARWWAYVEHRRRKLEKFSVAMDLHRKWQKRAAFNQWIESVHAASTEMEAKLAKAMEWAFGASLVPHHEQMARTRNTREAAKDGDAAHGWLLTGFGLDNLGVHVLHAWREVCLEKQRGTAHLRKADNHRRARVLDQAFLSWKIQSMPLSDADHAKMLGQGADVNLGPRLRRQGRHYAGARAGAGSTHARHVRRAQP